AAAPGVGPARLRGGPGRGVGDAARDRAPLRTEPPRGAWARSRLRRRARPREPDRPLAPPADEEGGRVLRARVLESLAAAPGVTPVSLARSVPLGLGGLTVKVRRPGDTEDETSGIAVGWNAVSPAYFDTMGIPLLSGRAFTAADGPRAPAVAIVNQSMVRRL